MGWVLTINIFLAISSWGPEEKESEKPIKLQRKSTSLGQQSAKTTDKDAWTPTYSSGAVVSVSDTPVKIFSETPVKITKQLTFTRSQSVSSITTGISGTGRSFFLVFRYPFYQ